ncbi:unnamed protein product, partial [Ectocarpus sp. 4 AP-2014]
FRGDVIVRHFFFHDLWGSGGAVRGLSYYCTLYSTEVLTFHFSDSADSVQSVGWVDTMPPAGVSECSPAPCHSRAHTAAQRLSGFSRQVYSLQQQPHIMRR